MCAQRGLDREQFWNVYFGCVEFGCDAESLRNFGACVGFYFQRLYAVWSAIVCLFVCGQCAGRECFWRSFWFLGLGCVYESLRDFCVCVGSFVAVVCSLERNSLFVCGECAGRVFFLRSFWFLRVWLCI